MDGAFDDNGVNPIAIAYEGDQIHLFYNGWQIPTIADYNRTVTTISCGAKP